MAGTVTPPEAEAILAELASVFFQDSVPRSTAGGVHSPNLEAAMIQNALEGWNHELDLLFIENVGNLVCPSSYDLGEDLRLVLLSVTEGEDKPLKYPTIFNTADLAVLTKMDLADAVEFDLAAADSNIQRVRPGMPLLKGSSKTGVGMAEWLLFLASARERFAQVNSAAIADAHRPLVRPSQ